MGQLVPWDSVWHPGADSATRVVFDHDVKVEGHELKAGEYSLWLVPHEHRPWTVVFSRAAHVFHKPYPGEADDVLRVDVTPESASHVETLEIEFPLGAPRRRGDADSLGDRRRSDPHQGAVQTGLKISIRRGVFRRHVIARP